MDYKDLDTYYRNSINITFFLYSFQEYIVDGVNHMRVQFYVSGSKRKATVHAEAKEV